MKPKGDKRGNVELRDLDDGRDDEPTYEPDPDAWTELGPPSGNYWRRRFDDPLVEALGPHATEGT